MTYSIAARCPKTGAFGIAITSSSICVASRCAWVGPLGAVLTQNITDPALGPAGLTLLRQGLGAGAVLDLLRAGTTDLDLRQIGVIDRYGNHVFHSGKQALATAAAATGESCFALGNLMTSKKVPAEMVAGYHDTSAESFPERLLFGLERGLLAGGETADERSAGLQVSLHFDWPVVDLRVDWHDDPIGQLRALWERYAPQQNDYKLRAIAPHAAPAF